LHRCESLGMDAALTAQPGWPLYNQGPLNQLLAFPGTASADVRIQWANIALADVDLEEEPDFYGLICYHLGWGYQIQADQSLLKALAKAITHFEAAEAAWQREDSLFGKRFLGRVQESLGRLYLQRQDGDLGQHVETALSWSQRAHETFGEGTPEQLNTCMLLGKAYLSRVRGERLQNIEQGIYYYNEALHLAEQGKLTEHLGQIEYSLAVAYRLRLLDHPAENYEQARKLAEKALTRFDQGTPNWTRTTRELATIYAHRQRGDRNQNLEQAIQYAKQALAVYDPQDHLRQWTLAQLTLGNLYCDRISGMRAANDRKAIRCFQAILDWCDQESDPLRWAEAMNNLGTVYASRSTSPSDVDYRDATDCFRQALEVRKPGALPSKALQTATNWGGLDFRFGNWDKAWNAFQTALEVGKALYQASSTEAGRRAELAETSRLYARAAYCLLQMGHPDQALLQLEQGKARLLAEALALGDSDLTRLPDSQRQDILEARRVVRELEAEMRLSPDTPARRSDRELAEELQHARATLNRFIEDIRSEHPDFMPTGLDLHGILEQIPQGGALIAPLVTSQGGAAFVLPDEIKTVSVEHVIPLEAFADDLLIGSQEDPGWIRAYAAYTLRQDDGSLQDWKAAIETLTGRLWNALMGPIHRRLADLGLAEGAPVTLMPQGGLGLLPLHAAWRWVDGTRRFFLDDYTVSYAPSAYVLSVGRRRMQDRCYCQPALLAVVNPTHDLIYAPIEGDVAAELFLSTARLTLVEDDATPEAVVRESAGRTCLHFACHGFYEWEDVMQSALVLAEKRRFTLSEIISKLNLNAARLVTLSACETGLTEFQRSPDEYIGLPAGFLQAGATAVVASLWAVNDLSTALLIKHFYICLLDGDPGRPNEGPLSLSSALRRAQQWLRDEVTAKMAAETCLQRAQEALQAKDVQAFKLAQEAFFYYDRKMPDSRPFTHPVYWAPFTMSGQ
jgi:CHAT domain-containing protein